MGTNTWSQDVDKAAANPIRSYKNIMYTFHFYANTHTDSFPDAHADPAGACADADAGTGNHQPYRTENLD